METRPLVGPDALPLYLRLADRIEEDLRAVNGADGARLPSERQLAERYDASRVTIRAALAELRERGLLVSLPARGWAIAAAPKPRGGTGTAGRVLGFTDLAQQRGLTMRSRVLSSGVRPATVREAELLNTVAGADLFEMFRLRYLNNMVIALEHNRLPLAVAPAMATTDFTVRSLYDVLREASPTQRPHYADYSVEARIATDDERAKLEITGPVPILAATQLTFNQEAAPIELTIQAYRGDRYTFRASITD
ncbi:GntR family transcriptional regulator [Paractinoplanes brasiliensis]|uniref:GntR family transcriptional regulator n=1 Tax=Paractinoplanes brasiliensis TaxID=52695 RepID=A0A4R6JYE6_9ACTN|nr:GntR family transcriptional regulator [Actinoplanes brasiliensis]TDO41850.1 GntR family transcriptional regulator [Actinoplanes brasiliensis]GID29872.1 transcriptional regulator [Actinoplanes brasiliensis]